MSSPHRYWRILITDNNAGDLVKFQNMELNTHVRTLNLLSPNVGYTGAMPSVVHEIRWDLGEPTQVGAYAFKASGDSAPREWTIDSSDDGIFWKTEHKVYAQERWATNETRFFEVIDYELVVRVKHSEAALKCKLIVSDLDGRLLQVVSTIKQEFVTIKLQDDSPVMVTLIQECGTTWRPGKYYAPGALILPVSVEATPFYYRNRKAGISLKTEPIWSTNPEVFTKDGDCTWEVVERLNQPITQAPLQPVRKSI